MAKFLNIKKRSAKLPNGHTARLELVEHPGAVLIVPFLTRDAVILLRQFRPVINAYIFELPAGTLEKGEQPLACARREIIEETGYSAKKLTRLGIIYPVPGYSTEKITMYKAENLTERGSACEADEVIETLVVTKKTVREFFAAGKIIDAKTICAFAHCGWL
ncbi:MAG: NUDIX hydrolase [Deltaproteobacteria bacterium]|nr:NUDIX hydrolase [Deltaproteobacteria bacterium]